MLTFTLAKIIGVYALIAGFSILIERKLFLKVLHEVIEERALSYIIGTAMVIFGIVLVMMHNIWSNVPAAVVSLISWGILLEGTLYLFLSKKTIKKYWHVLDNKKAYYTFAVSYILMGVYLLYIGFVLG